jgi:hypothetical protein
MSDNDQNQQNRNSRRRRGRGNRRSSNDQRANTRGANNNGRRGRSRGGRRSNQRADGASFWGNPAPLPPSRRDVRITDDPAAVPRSLGAPPLAGHEQIAEHYFAAVYDRAVTTAGALAAAGGLIDPEDAG